MWFVLLGAGCLAGCSAMGLNAWRPPPLVAPRLADGLFGDSDAASPQGELGMPKPCASTRRDPPRRLTLICNCRRRVARRGTGRRGRSGHQFHQWRPDQRQGSGITRVGTLPIGCGGSACIRAKVRSLESGDGTAGNGSARAVAFGNFLSWIRLVANEAPLSGS